MILPRFSKGTPTESNSRLYQPDAMPRTRRPLEMRSIRGELLGEKHGVADRQHEDAGAELDVLGARGDRRQKRERVDDGEMRLDAEEDVVPHPERIEAELLHPHTVLDERRRVRQLGKGGEVPHGDSEGVRESGHGRSLWVRVGQSLTLPIPGGMGPFPLRLRERVAAERPGEGAQGIFFRNQAI